MTQLMPILLAYFTVSISIGKSIVICNRMNRSSFNKTHFVIEQLMHARNDLGLEHNYPSTLSIEFLNRNKNYLKRLAIFYNEVSWNALMVYHCNNSFISYVRIFKCGSKGITFNLDSLECITENGQLKKARRIHYDKHEEFIKEFSHKAIKLFTFIRDPLEHFLSGFSESVWHNSSTRSSINSKSIKKINSADVKEVLEEMLRQDSTRLWPIERGFQHTFTMSNVFFEYNIEIIGQIEQFEVDWNNKIRKFYNISKLYMKSYGKHPTSINHPSVTGNRTAQDADPNNARASVLQLFRDDKRYKRVVCRLILIDYICFPMYSLPFECQFLNETVNKYRSILLNNVTSS